jgi:hypothetical protein
MLYNRCEEIALEKEEGKRRWEGQRQRVLLNIMRKR